MRSPVEVVLALVDEAALLELVRAATSDASAHEVTPPLDAGTEWSPTRITWLRSFHRDRRSGLLGPAREATWAVTVEAGVVGSVRLAHTEVPRVLETGIWLTRSARHQGVGQAALTAVLREAERAGAEAVRAETTAANASALVVLQRLGFALSTVADDGGVSAVIQLD